MELLNLLGEENSEVKKAIQFLLDSDIIEAEWYQRKQRFTLSPTEIDYCTQREHAIDWFFSKTLWNKSNEGNNNGIELSKLIKNIQCAPLIIYLSIVTNILTEKQAETIVKTKIKILEQSEEYNSKNIRFAEKREIINEINEIGDEGDWSKMIAKILLGI